MKAKLAKLTQVSIQGRVFVALDEVLALLAQEQPEPPTVPRRAKDEKDEAKASA